MRLLGMIRGLGLAALILGGAALAFAAASVLTAGVSQAQTASSIVVEGNRRVEANTIRSYFHGPGGSDRLDAASIDAGIKALYATGLFQDVRINHSGERPRVYVVGKK